MTLINKLLRQHISVGQLTGFFMANLVGLVIILSAIQLNSDISPLFSQSDGLVGKEYIVITKPIHSPRFDEAEIEALMAQPFTTDVGRFVPAQFRVYADVTLGRHSMGTYMFFEAVPDKFLDVDTEEWRYDAERRVIPIIVPRNYLNLYNLGFARSQGLPQISEEVIGNIALNMTLGDRSNSQEFTGYVVGFTNRLNTILVPHDIMEWANSTFAPDKQQPMARLIIEVDNPADEAINSYFNQHGYEVEGDSADNSKGRFLVRVFISILISIGAVICLLSVYILTLSIYLLLHKNSSKLANLIALGYTTRMVSRPYIRLTVVLNAAILLLDMALTLLFRRYYLGLLSEAFTLGDAGITTTLVAGVALSLIIIGFNALVIRRYIGRIAARKSTINE